MFGLRDVIRENAASPALKEYERLLGQDRQVLGVKDLGDDDIEAIGNAEPSERSRKLDEIMEDARTS